MKYFIIAGEASGDLHGSNLMKSLKETDQQADFFCFGGDLMEQQGGKLLRHFREMAFMGAIDVIMNSGKIARNFSLCRQALIRYKPDVLILIDYPGFNLKVAEFAHKHRIPVFYYILPKVWAWKEWRVKKLRAYADELFSIFPFEVDFFRRHGLEVHYSGNPLQDSVLEALPNFRSREKFLLDNNLPDMPLVALLPGSRDQEIRSMLPVMARIGRNLHGYCFVISGTPAVERSLYNKYSAESTIPVLSGQTYELLHHSQAALVTSGTATLETALLGIPQAVLYKMAGGKLGWRLFRSLFLKVKYVSLPNLVLGKEIVKEFIMEDMKYENIFPEINRLLSDPDYRKEMLRSYEEMKMLMGEKGVAFKIAEKMSALLSSKYSLYGKSVP